MRGTQNRTHALLEDLDALIPEEELDGGAEEEALLEELRDEARAYLGLQDKATTQEIQAAFGESLELFWEFFFAHYRQDEEGNDTPGAPFHEQLRLEIQTLIRGEAGTAEMAKACPREHSKSVNASLVAPIWALASGHRRFAFLFSDTDTQAWGFLEDIRIEVETNERLRAVYPAFCGFKGKPRVNRLVFGNDALMMAAGSGKSVRGARKGAQRPDLIILDDIENDTEVENPKRRRKKMTWFNKVVKKLGRASVYLIVGTVLHADSFLANRIKSDERDVHRAIVEYPTAMALWDEWEKVLHDRSKSEREQRARAFYEERQRAMDAGAVVLWPAKFTLYELMLERAEDLASFLSERQNDPFDPAGSYFPEEALAFLEGDDKPALEQVRLSVGFWDPSRGTSKSDTSAAFRLDVLHDGRRFVSQGITGRIPPEEVIDTIVGMHKVRAFYAFGVEKVGLSNYDGDLQRVSRAAGVSLPVHPITPSGEKQLRIKSMRPLVVSGGLLFAADLPREAVQQIKYYGQHPNDDVWDAVQQANQLADAFLTDVAPAGGVVEPAGDGLRDEHQSVLGTSAPADMPRFGERLGILGRIFS